MSRFKAEGRYTQNNRPQTGDLAAALMEWCPCPCCKSHLPWVPAISFGVTMVALCKRCTMRMTVTPGLDGLVNVGALKRDYAAVQARTELRPTSCPCR